MLLAVLSDYNDWTLAKVYEAGPGQLALVALRLGPADYIRRALDLALAGRVGDVVAGGSRRDTIEDLDVYSLRPSCRAEPRGFLPSKKPRVINPQRLR